MTEPVLLDHLFRRQAGRMVAHLARRMGPAHLAVAEEAVQEAMVRALQSWPRDGIPPNPEAWLLRVARNAALDTVRRARLFAGTAESAIESLAVQEPRPLDLEQQFRDDELAMIFMCCHPAIPRDAAVALSLKTVGGFGVAEIARAFLAEEATVAQRLVRAKRLIRDRGIELEAPSPPEAAARLDSVLETIYLIFNEGYSTGAGDALIREDLCGEALRLATLLASSPFCQPRVHALVALIAFQAARLPARVDELGDIILLEEQDRSRWDRRLIALAFQAFDASIAGNDVSTYHVEAAIAATHARAAAEGRIPWETILALYDQLAERHPSPVVALNRAVAIWKVRGAAEALAQVERIGGADRLRDYHLLLATRARLLLELHRNIEAAECYRAALSMQCSEPERRFLHRKLSEIVSPRSPQTA